MFTAKDKRPHNPADGLRIQSCLRAAPPLSFACRCRATQRLWGVLENVAGAAGDPTCVAWSLEMPRAKRVYIVDAETSVRSGLTRILSEQGYDVRSYASAAAFLADAAIDHPCCLLLDVCLTEQSGFRLQLQLHQLEANVQIVFMTAHGDIAMGVRAMKAGAIDFLTKPLRTNELVDGHRARARKKPRAAWHRGSKQLAGARALRAPDAEGARGPGAGAAGPAQQADRGRARQPGGDGQGSPLAPHAQARGANARRIAAGRAAARPGSGRAGRACATAPRRNGIGGSVGAKGRIAAIARRRRRVAADDRLNAKPLRRSAIRHAAVVAHAGHDGWSRASVPTRPEETT